MTQPSSTAAGPSQDDVAPTPLAHAASTPAAVPTADPGPVVETAAGSLRGIWRSVPPSPGDAPYTRSAAFYNIPYAEAPIGERRFMAPVPAAPWEGVRESTMAGPTPQRRPFGVTTAIPEPSVPGEDILNLNVFTPVPSDTDAKLPVLVWIHGGGFFAGSHNSPYYDGAAFNRDGVVTVSISYRLGFDGFGWVPDSNAPLNRGLLDQVMGLQWVHDNIEAFGGDPSRVTIAGQSAGGASVLALMCCPRAKGLFHGVISQSGVLVASPANHAQSVTTRGAVIAGIEPTLAGWRSLTEDQILDNASELDKEFSLFTQIFNDGLKPYIEGTLPMMGTYMPVLDGDVLPNDLRQAVRDGISDNIALLIGVTRHEFSFIGQIMADKLAALCGGADKISVDTMLADAGLDKDDIDLFHRCNVEIFSRPNHDLLAIGQIVSNAMFHLPMIELSLLREEKDVTAAHTWLYDFAWGCTLEDDNRGLAPHCQEIPFVFDCVVHPHGDTVQGPVRPQELADQAHADWVRFIVNQDPGWQPWAQAHTGRVYGDAEHNPVGACDMPVFEFEYRLLTRD